MTSLLVSVEDGASVVDSDPVGSFGGYASASQGPRRRITNSIQPNVKLNYAFSRKLQYTVIVITEIYDTYEADVKDKTM
jgi:hypothetical protein